MQLTRNRIVGTAIEMIERGDVAALSMRELASELGCGVVPLYDRVPSKDALLDRVAAAVMSEIDRTARQEQESGGHDRVRTLAKAFRDVGRTYPRCTVLAASRQSASGALQASGEGAAGVLPGAGFDGRVSGRLARAILAYVVGSILRDACLTPGLRGGEDDEDFEFGLDLLLRAMVELSSVQAS
jgi:AcrR family transcriptional regulator